MPKVSFHNFFSRDRNNLLLVATIAILVVLPILIYGVPYGYDMPHHYQCALTYLDAIKSGDFYPSWTLDRNLGYGALELRMYPPLSHYVLAIFALVFNDWHLATWVNYTFWWILGGIGIYLFAREFVKPQAALFASALFSVMPYRLSQLYLTFLYSELCAIAILPFCFLFLTRILKEAAQNEESDIFSRKSVFSMSVLGFAVSYTALILTHLPMTLIGTLSIGIYFFAQVKWNAKYLQAVVLKTVCGLILGLTATSFFWIKVLQERFLMAKNSVYDDITTHYQLNFLFTFIQSYDDFSIEVYKTITQVYDAILFLTLLIILPVAFLGLFSEKSPENHLRRGIWRTLIIAIFLTTVLSRPIWNTLPLLSEVQFPWRFLGVISIFASVIAAAGFTNLVSWFQNEKRRPYAIIIAGTFVVGCFFGINQSIRGAIYKDNSAVKTFVQDVSQKEGFTFWWTIWARKDFVNDKGREIVVSSRPTKIIEWKRTERIFSIEQGSPSEVYVATFYHPNWQATVNDTPTQILPASDGGMLISVPTDESTVKVFFQETFLTRISRWFSVCAWLLIFLLLGNKAKSLIYKNKVYH
jgi:hypothetical protein